jgi:hypothetical protein
MIRPLVCLAVFALAWGAGAETSAFLHRNDPAPRTPPTGPTSQRWDWVQTYCQPPSPEPACRTLPSPR